VDEDDPVNDGLTSVEEDDPTADGLTGVEEEDPTVKGFVGVDDDDPVVGCCGRDREGGGGRFVCVTSHLHSQRLTWSIVIGPNANRQVPNNLNRCGGRGSSSASWTGSGCGVGADAEASVVLLSALFLVLCLGPGFALGTGDVKMGKSLLRWC
jgi:hypothetical protein